ncbi:hypothetical protein [Solibacillus ferritrahens]|uniref:hypothetical protein n=1 Tax=Solibacillus ferritrahens TaxID=3098620 RepID=UPI00300A97E5
MISEDWKLLDVYGQLKINKQSKEEIKLLATELVYYYFETEDEINIKQLLEELSVINNELITEVVQITLCNIQIDALPQQENYANIRKACVGHLSNHLNDSINFFISKQTHTALLAGMLLHFEVHDSKNSEKIWEAYLTVIENNEIFWSYNLQKDLDDYQFLWLSAGILAQQDKPLESFKLAVNRINHISEGWGIADHASNKKYKQIIHLYMVGAMASEWLVAKERNDEAAQLYNYVFHKTTSYLRNSIPYEKDIINPLIIELWSRLPRIKPADYLDIALYTIPLYDEYKHILLALTELYYHSNNKIDIKLLMREIHEEFFPLEKIMYAHDENILNWYEQFDWWLE